MAAPYLWGWIVAVLAATIQLAVSRRYGPAARRTSWGQGHWQELRRQPEPTGQLQRIRSSSWLFLRAIQATPLSPVINGQMMARFREDRCRIGNGLRIFPPTLTTRLHSGASKGDSSASERLRKKAIEIDGNYFSALALLADVLVWCNSDKRDRRLDDCECRGHCG